MLVCVCAKARELKTFICGEKLEKQFGIFVNRGLIILALNSLYCWEGLLLRWGWMYFRDKEKCKISLWVCWIPKTILKEWAWQLTNWSFILLSKNSMTYNLGTSLALNHFILITTSYYEWVTIFIVPTLKMRKLMHREVKWIFQGHTTTKWLSQAVWLWSPCP